jgi:hypothetical protein
MAVGEHCSDAAGVGELIAPSANLESADPHSISPLSGGEKREPLVRSLSSRHAQAGSAFLPLKGGGLRWGSRAARGERQSVLSNDETMTHRRVSDIVAA